MSCPVSTVLLMQLVLASSSPYRRELLQRLGLPFVWGRPDVDEQPLPGETIAVMTQRLALAKANALVQQYPQALIIGSDQACQRQGEAAILGKPGDFTRAQQQLTAASGRVVEFHTALVLLNSATGYYENSHDIFKVHFRELSSEEITAYLHQEEPYDCAGSFKAEALGITLFRGMEGKDFHSLIGLPLISLCDLLRRMGKNPLQRR
jgi:septum formation protein